jgi:predicted dehydrogenase
MNHLTRRTFLKTTATIAAGAALSARSWGQVSGANTDIRVAVIGLNGRGKSHLQSLAELPGVRIVALCDPDSAVLQRTKGFKTKSGKTPVIGARTFTDIRELLAMPDLDAVTIATPNHWHSLAAIWACAAGKDVYVEKPVSHNVWEGRQLVSAARKYNRVVQAGTQIRSGAGLREAVEWVRAGNLGRITAARGFCYKYRGSIGLAGATPPPPASVNLDLWCGPTPLAAPHRKRFHYDWHWQYVTGNGDVGNQGIHQMDVARWFLGEGLPQRTLSIGGRLGYTDDGNTPNTQVVIHEYATAPLIFEVRGLPARSGAVSAASDATGSEAADAGANAMDKYRGVRVGNVIDCEGGSVIIPSYTEAHAVDKNGKAIKDFKGHDQHMANFIAVVRSRKTADLYGPIEEGHRSSALCHLGNISHQLGRAMKPEELRARIKGDAALNEAVGRMNEHLAANHVDLNATPAILGVPLLVDAANERFTGELAGPANALLTREYRASFVVPKLA